MSKEVREVILADEIRRYRKKHPDQGPTAVAKGLKELGIETTAQYVSTISNLDKKKSGQGTGRRGRKNGEISFTELQEAKKIANHLGGVERAKQILSALSELAD